MAAAPYILARTFAEGHNYALETLGLEKGSYRIVNSPSTLRAVRNVDLHLVPGWKKRFDRFSMISALKWSRMNVIDVEKQAEEPAETEIEYTLDATDFVTANIGTRDAQSDPPEDLENAALEEPNKRTRRRRCKDCGNLFEPEEIEKHAKTHEAS